MRTLNYDSRSVFNCDLAHIYQDSKTVQHCRFQLIGCILGVIDSLETESDAERIAEEGYAVGALINLTDLEESISRSLIPLTNVRLRFETVWHHLTDYDRADALSLDYDYFDNFWPGFEYYNQTLLPYIQLPSGTAENIMSVPTTV